MAHVVTVSEGMWKWAAKKSKKKNPASFLRDLLVEARHSYDDDGEQRQADADDDGEDEGTLISIKRPAFCSKCSDVLKPGVYALIQNGKISCAKHRKEEVARGRHPSDEDSGE